SKPARPSVYSAELGQAICESIAAGRPLLAICEAPDMPNRITVWRWQQQHPEFRNMITAAREYGADALAEQCLVIADDGRDVPRDTPKITARRWLASKIAPRRYGDRIATEVSGPGGGPIEARAAPQPMVPAEVANEVRKLVDNAEAAAGLPPGSGTDV